MLRITQSMSADHAKAYFTDSLKKSDYYVADQEHPGRWGGKLAARLGLDGTVTKDAFFALTENRDPITGGALTPRTKEERTVGYDLTFVAPKSVSVLAALAKDDHIRRAFEDAVNATMLEIQQDAQVRVRVNGADHDRPTQEILYASFLHTTARPVGNAVSDPHWHQHVYLFNCSWDAEEGRMKALQFRNIYRDANYYQARFLKRLSDRMIEMGYEVRRTDGSFEVVNVPQRVIDLFSKRSQQIAAVAAEKGIYDAKALNELTIRTRERKAKGLSMAELKTDWKRQIAALGEDKEEGEKPVRFAPVKARIAMEPAHCVQYAMDHTLERASVVQDRRLLQHAYHYAIGNKDISLDAVTDSFLRDDRIISIEERGRTMVTTYETLAEEKRMVELARAGRGGVAPIYSKTPSIDLEGQQHDAVAQILTSHNRCETLRGGAGTGKTTLMTEAVRLIEAAGLKVIPVAPSAQASRGVLREEGFANAETVARLLTDETMQKRLNGNVLWVDEAGMLGVRDTVAILELAEKHNAARVVLAGDPSQHASIVRGDALRILHDVAGLKPAEVSKIYRQRPEDYRAAVYDLSQGNIEHGFDKLDTMGSVIEVDPLRPYDTLVADYMSSVKAGKSSLVICPTHKQGEEVMAAIREKLRQTGRIGQKEITAKRLIALNYTEAQKGDWQSLHPGQLIQFNQNQTGFQRAGKWTVKAAEDGKVIVHDHNGKEAVLPLDAAKHYDVYGQSEIPISKGDKLHVTRGAFDLDNKRLNNGTALQVLSVSRKGKIIAHNPDSKVQYVLDQDFGHIAHAHCITSHASQGKTVDHVFIAQPSATFAASNAKQFYVSVSRGRDVARIYTDDKRALLEQVSLMGNRTSALELVGEMTPMDHVIQQQRNIYGIAPERSAPARVPIPSPVKAREYEQPEL